ncbi:MAG TPA: hypothetical protein VFB12_25635 [Ktedonobacteraceae bacterium]|nr:hypothetical protein [Ktedonobacteraceae bacterium]
MNDESKFKPKKLTVSAVQAATIIGIIVGLISIYQFVTGNQSIPASFTPGSKSNPAIQISPTLAPTIPPTLVPTATSVSTATPAPTVTSSSPLASIQSSFQNTVHSTILSIQSAHQPIRYDSFWPWFWWGIVGGVCGCVLWIGLEGEVSLGCLFGGFIGLLLGSLIGLVSSFILSILQIPAALFFSVIVEFMCIFGLVGTTQSRS